MVAKATIPEQREGDLEVTRARTRGRGIARAAGGEHVEACEQASLVRFEQRHGAVHVIDDVEDRVALRLEPVAAEQKDRKSTRLNSSHVKTSYAVFCWKKKK